MRSVQILVGDPFLAATLDLPFRRAVGSDRVLRCWDGLALLEFVSSTGRYRYEPVTDDLRLIVMHEALPIMGPGEVARRIRTNPSVRDVSIVVVGEGELGAGIEVEHIEHLDDEIVRDLLERAGIEATPGFGERRPIPEETDELKRIRHSEASRRGGLKGGRIRAQRLSPERRAEIARQAARARWRRDR
jgi:hypothetical protein